MANTSGNSNVVIKTDEREWQSFGQKLEKALGQKLEELKNPRF
ncbi:hypothetical protein ACGTJS_02885 [Faucicola mancuniensis]|nr:hypothetical protein [uncultured Moraxella sp.]